MTNWKIPIKYELWLYKDNKPYKRIESSFDLERLGRSRDRKNQINKKYHPNWDFKIIVK